MSAEITALWSWIDETIDASMGPRSDERGNDGIVTDERVVAELQWGRARMSAEIY